MLRVLDMPQAVALAAAAEGALHVKDEEAAKAWEWPVPLQKATGGGGLRVRVVGE